MSHQFKDIYIGPIIKAKVDEEGIAYAEFARRIGCARTSLYSIFNSKSIDIERLLVISDVLNFNFIYEIYLKDFIKNDTSDCFLQLPFKNGRIDCSNLPKELLMILKETIDDDLDTV